MDFLDPNLFKKKKRSGRRKKRESLMEGRMPKTVKASRIPTEYLMLLRTYC